MDCLTYSANDVSAAGGNPRNLTIGLIYNPPGTAGSSIWTQVVPFDDAANSRVCTSQTRVFYEQAMFAPALRLPVTGDTAEQSRLWLLGAVGFIGAALVTLSLVRHIGAS
jgi:hypothetical protein